MNYALKKGGFSALFLLFDELLFEKTLSIKSINRPPHKKPIDGNSILFIPRASLISIAGDISEKKLAAIITPAARLNILSKTVLFTFLKKYTIAEPKRVINQVNKVAKKAIKIGDKLSIKTP